MEQYKESLESAHSNFWLLLATFVETNLKLVQAINQKQTYHDDDIESLERLGKNAQVIHDLLFDR